MDISISLTPELVGLLKTKVESGRYASASEVVSQALRLLERAEQDDSELTARLHQAWADGLTSGDAGPLDFAELKADARRELTASAKK